MGVLAKMRGKVRFDRRGLDANGDPLGPYQPFATVAARLRYMRGGEEVLQHRIVGVQPVVVTVRASTTTRQINTGDRAVDARTGETLDIKSVAPDEAGAFIEILCEDGN